MMRQLEWFWELLHILLTSRRNEKKRNFFFKYSQRLQFRLYHGFPEFFIFFKCRQDEIRIGFYLSEALANRSWRIHWPRPTIAVNWQRTFCCSHRRLGWHRKHFCNRWLKPDDISLDHQYPKPKEKSIQFVKLIFS